MAARKAKDGPIYQLKVTLLHIRPPIWRRIQVAGDITLGTLHDVIQAIMGWGGYHLHQFIVGDTYYGTPHPELETRSEQRVRLSQVAPAEGARFVYEYDFGDSWEHEILVEKILPPEAGVRYPICIKGKRATPPEDCGGPWGYEDLVETLKNPQSEQHDEMMEWVGGDFDPEAFDLDVVNAALAGLR